MPRAPRTEKLYENLVSFEQVRPPDEGPPEWRIRLRDTMSTTIAWTEFGDTGWKVYWKDLSGVRTEWSRHTPSTSKEHLIQSLWSAADKALRAGGWLGKIHREFHLMPPDAPFLRAPHVQRRRPVPDIVPIGAATALIFIEALAKYFYVGTRTMKKFLDRVGVPLLECANGQKYVSLWVMELAIMRNLLPDLTWSQAADLVKTGQTVYGAARKTSTIDRLRKLAAGLKPSSRMLQKAAGRGSRRNPRTGKIERQKKGEPL